MTGFQSGRVCTIVAVVTTPAPQLLHGMRKRGRNPRRLVMADTALLGRRDMAAGLAGGRAAVMA